MVTIKTGLNLISIASQANVGGHDSAKALARSLKKHNLFIPVVLLGTEAILSKLLRPYGGQFLFVSFFHSD